MDSGQIRFITQDTGGSDSEGDSENDVVDPSPLASVGNNNF